MPVLIWGCSRMDTSASINLANASEPEMPYNYFDSKSSLRNCINKGNTDMSTKGTLNSNTPSLFSSIKEVDILNDPILSYEYGTYGDKSLEDNVTIYDKLRYDDLIPNKSFARLLNARGELCVGETMYKISPRGTYYFPISLRTEFERSYAGFENSEGKLVSEDTYEMAPSIFRFDTFKKKNAIAYTPEFACDASEYPTKATSSFPSFLWSNFPTYSGNDLDNQQVMYSLPENRRVWTQVYHHDYIVYDERGALLKCQKSGFWGWTSVTSQELMITWKNIILKGGHNTGELVPPSNTIPTFFTTTYPYMGYNETMVEIRGYVVPDNQLNNVVVGGNPTLRSIILNSTGIDIGTAKVLRLSGHDYVQYIFVGTWFVSGSNTNEVAMALSEEILGKTYVPVGGQFWYQALDDNGNLGALRVGTAF